MTPVAWIHLAIGLAFGLAALTYGFTLLSRGLGAVATAGLQRKLATVTGAPLRGVLAGAVATALVHSSSLTTILIVGLVDAGGLSLRRAVPLIMGANIGTTITAQFLAVPLPPLGWVLTAAGAVAWWAAPREGWPPQGWGQAAAGLGLLFLALQVLDMALAPLAQTSWFTATLAGFGAHPWLGILAGTGLTALVLSSSVTVGLLQRLAAQGLLPLPAALPVLFGDNIGTTADTLWAALSAGREARAAALAHLLFNLLGTVIFLPLAPMMTTVVQAISSDPARQIAHAHTLFNGANTLLLLPFSGALAKAGFLLTAWVERGLR